MNNLNYVTYTNSLNTPSYTKEDINDLQPLLREIVSSHPSVNSKKSSLDIATQIYYSISELGLPCKIVTVVPVFKGTTQVSLVNQLNILVGNYQAKVNSHVVVLCGDFICDSSRNEKLTIFEDYLADLKELNALDDLLNPNPIEPYILNAFF